MQTWTLRRSHPSFYTLSRRALTCPIPDVCIDERRLPLFFARATLRELIAGLKARATGGLRDDAVSAQSSHCPPSVRGVASGGAIGPNPTGDGEGDDDPGDPGEDCSQRRTGCGPCAALWAVFVKQVVRRFHAASLISGTQASRSGLSQTGPAGCRLRVFPDQRPGFFARAFA